MSRALRKRLDAIDSEYAKKHVSVGHFLNLQQLSYLYEQQFPGEHVGLVFSDGSYERVLVLVEILYDYAGKLHEGRRASLRDQLREAFRLSGSVYALSTVGRIELIPSEVTAKQLNEVRAILSPYDACNQAFIGAAGDLMGRRRKPDDIVKDLWIGTEGYLKAITGEKDFAPALKALRTDGTINPMQSAIIDKLHGYRSDAHGAAHATDSPAPTEAEALWFLETLLAQIAHIGRNRKRAA